jgi:hypothetical protein
MKPVSSLDALTPYYFHAVLMQIHEEGANAPIWCVYARGGQKFEVNLSVVFMSPVGFPL